ncbi:hypothetical protein [Streptomyces griseorubiginosus]|uniref:hypothetical protein n=1 Tax=Streptomyces griseorubiginosus TaxID=67304 RepID=UPI0036EE63F2
MRVKLRPDAHCAPVPQGVYWSRAGTSFVMTGPSALYTLIDDRLDALLDGTSVDDLVAGTGNEAARPVFEYIVRTLVDRRVMIDLDAAEGPVPDAETALQHAELLAYLEARCDEPYRAFATVRSAWVAVVGEGAAAEAALRGLAANGTGTVTRHAFPGSGEWAAEPSMVVLTDDHEHPLDLVAAAESLPVGVPVLPAVAEAGFALVGPVCAGPEQLRSFQAVRLRAAEWQRAGVANAAPRPLSAVLAGSLAAQAVLARLSATESDPGTALLVHGHTVQTRAIELPVDGQGTVWQPVDVGEVLAAPVAAAAGTPAPADGDDEGPADPQEIPRLAIALTTRWTGLARWNADLDLPQLPASLVTARIVAAAAGTVGGTADALLDAQGTPNVLGWGSDRASAGVSAVLAILRHRTAQDPREAGEAGFPAAGLTQVHWLADGLLRQAGHHVLGQSPGTLMTWDELGNGSARTFWSLLRDHFGVPTQLRLRTLPGLGWLLASVVEEGTGEVLASQWGPTPVSAAHQALFGAVARVQFQAAQKTAPQAPVLPPDAVGTSALEVVSVRQVHACLRQLLDQTRSTGTRLHARQLTHDEVVGELPLVCGWVGLG